jgi:hypothetical protein
MVATRRPSPAISPSRLAGCAAALGAASLLGILAPACANPLPGTQLGTFQVTATAAANTCGLGAPSAYQFDVQLSQLGSTLYWSWLDDSPIVSGALAPVSSTDAQLQASLTASQSANVDATDAGAGPCTMDRTDSLVVTLAAASPPGSFTGTLSYSFTVESGADCSDQLTSTGGIYDTLPCAVSYTLAATLQ